VAELYCQLGVNVWGKEYDVVLGGGFLNTRSPYNIKAGPVQYGDLQMVLPFDNQIVLCSIKGRYLLSRFINGNSSYFVSYSPYGNEVKGKIDPNATYYVVVDSYTAQYGPNKLTVVKEYDPTVFARDLLADYIAGGGWS
jgi:2',3'-cyclic-nucleotide 2'-phosphodiesterase (5'-nucleotidase family)